MEYSIVRGARLAKRVIASILVLMLLNFEAALADIIPNTGDFNTNTSVNTDGNMTNITGGYIHGDTGFHHFSDFDIANGHIVNQIFGNANRFVNLVDNRVIINGIFNAIKNGQINGDVVFVSPMGIFVGTTGIMNVGSLQTIAPTQQAYQTLINEGRSGSLSWDSGRFNALELNRTIYSSNLIFVIILFSNLNLLNSSLSGMLLYNFLKAFSCTEFISTTLEKFTLSLILLAFTIFLNSSSGTCDFISIMWLPKSIEVPEYIG